MYFNRPYQFVNSTRARLLRCVLFGAFVFLFLFVFKPFGLAETKSSLPYITLGYGLVCTVVMVLLNIAMVPVLPRFFSEQNWTLGRELAWTAVNVFFIGLANALYTAIIGVSDFSWMAVLSFEIYTLSLGLFPAAMAIVLNEARLKHQFEQETDEINNSLHPNQASLLNSKARVYIVSENANENFNLELDQLLFIKASDNYAEVIFLESEITSRKVVRNTLKNLEAAVENEQIFRCHKSYLVNLACVERLSGNAQGYKLHLKNCEDEIPVSRQHNKTIKAKLAAHP